MLGSGEQKLELKCTANRRGAKQCGLFLKGPVPMKWLEAAAKLGGKCLHVGAKLWQLYGMRGEGTVKFARKDRESMSVSGTSSHRALERMEKAGLVRVDRRRGRCPRVTILKDDKA